MANTFKENTKTSRLFRLLRLMLDNPYGYTITDLFQKCEISLATTKRYMEELRIQGFDITHNDDFRYAIANDHSFEYLRDKLFFTETEQDYLNSLIQQNDSSSNHAKHLKEKLETIYDYTRLGSHLLSRQTLSKIHALEKAKAQQTVVHLIDYRSTNSGTVSTKVVEPFHIMPREDILHAFDVDADVIRHYRISRIPRVELTHTAWTHTPQHHIMPTDPFRIADETQIHIIIKMRVGGYNELLERFPLTKQYLEPSATEKDVFIYEGPVNSRFFGLSNFIMGYHHHIIDIQSPDSLLQHIKNEAKKIQF